MPTHHQYLYLSQLVDSYQYDVFADVCLVSRARNGAAALRGILLFDGHRFCGLIEGPAPAAQDLIAAIVRDPRHTAMAMLADRPLAAVTRLTDWLPGFCAPDELDIFEGPHGLRDESALLAFHRLSSRAELSP